MPKINIDEFDEAPKIGDKVRVTGKVKEIDEDSGEVEISYDEVKIVKVKDRKKDDSDSEVEVETMDEEIMPESQSTDAALARYFQNTQ